MKPTLYARLCENMGHWQRVTKRDLSEPMPSKPRRIRIEVSRLMDVTGWRWFARAVHV